MTHLEKTIRLFDYLKEFWFSQGSYNVESSNEDSSEVQIVRRRKIRIINSESDSDTYQRRSIHYQRNSFSH